MIRRYGLADRAMSRAYAPRTAAKAAKVRGKLLAAWGWNADERPAGALLRSVRRLWFDAVCACICGRLLYTAPLSGTLAGGWTEGCASIRGVKLPSSRVSALV